MSVLEPNWGHGHSPTVSYHFLRNDGEAVVLFEVPRGSHGGKISLYSLCRLLAEGDGHCPFVIGSWNTVSQGLGTPGGGDVQIPFLDDWF